MEFIELIFGVIAETNPMSPTDRAKLKQEIQADWDNVVTEEDREGFKNDLKTKFVKWTKGPWVRLAFALGFIFIVKKVKDYMAGRLEDNETEE